MMRWWPTSLLALSAKANPLHRRRALLQPELLEHRINPVLFFTADLAISQAASVTAPVNPDQPLSYTLTITNNGPDPVASFKVVNRTPAGLVNPTFTPSSGTYDPATGRFSLPNRLASGNSVTLVVAGTVSTSATQALVNVAKVSPPRRRF